jgi:hypothetical protein
MSNQIILWGTLILPWLTLLFMHKNDIKRYIPTGLLSTLLCIIVIETGIRYNWWVIRETTFPFSVIPTYAYGLFPIIPMWLLKYTLGRFGLFIILDTIMNIVFAYIILPWFAHRGIVVFDAELIVLIFESIIAFILYGFQMSQERFYIGFRK